ncbi:hypothetical protein SAMN04487843_103119 [Methylobacterium sp. ap11]|uniref:hypothetical protein n=1 Tax=Methylobacterium sp. ap11 TaxID=1761799 RepID=UPI0008D35C26|nr:hypothetical protein [Methylobacterium sp. ap11]SEO69997.1 hypothetical protein SAMN04487843_103119 [Methylobacterium sp. ap11]
MRLRSLLLALFLLAGFGGLAGASPLMPSAAVTTALDQPSTVETVRWRRHRHWHRRHWHRRHWHHRRHYRRHWHHRRHYARAHYRRHRHVSRRHVGRLHFSRPAARPVRWIEPRRDGR